MVQCVAAEECGGEPNLEAANLAFTSATVSGGRESGSVSCEDGLEAEVVGEKIKHSKLARRVLPGLCARIWSGADSVTVACNTSGAPEYGCAGAAGAFVNGCRAVQPFGVNGVVAAERLVRAAGVLLPDRSFCHMFLIRPVTLASASLSVPDPKICETGLEDPEDKEGRAELCLDSNELEALCWTCGAEEFECVK